MVLIPVRNQEVSQFLTHRFLKDLKEKNNIYVICKQILMIDGVGVSNEVAFSQMSLDLTNEKLTLVQN